MIVYLARITAGACSWKDVPEPQVEGYLIALPALIAPPEGTAIAIPARTGLFGFGDWRFGSRLSGCAANTRIARSRHIRGKRVRVDSAKRLNERNGLSDAGPPIRCPSVGRVRSGRLYFSSPGSVTLEGEGWCFLWRRRPSCIAGVGAETWDPRSSQSPPPARPT